LLTLLRDDCRRALRSLDAGAFRCCVTSPPYWEQRSYLADDHPEKALEIGHEATPEAYVEVLVNVFREVRRVLAEDGTLWVNVGAAYARRSSSGSLVASTLQGSQSAQIAYRGSRPGKTSQVQATWSGKQGRAARLAPGWKDKDLIPLPWMLGLALRADGWWLRMDNIWAPPDAMPESVTDRPTHAHEYFYDVDAIREPQTMRPQRRPNGHKPLKRPGQPENTWSTTARDEAAVDGNPLGRNCRSVWGLTKEQGDGQHVAPMPRALARRCILAGSARGDRVLDPFGGRGTVGSVAEEEGRHATLIDLDERAVAYARTYTAQMGLPALAAGGSAS
jgi:DNA modification methylase